MKCIFIGFCFGRNLNDKKKKFKVNCHSQQVACIMCLTEFVHILIHETCFLCFVEFVIAGNTTDFVNEVIEKVEEGDMTGGLPIADRSRK